MGVSTIKKIINMLHLSPSQYTIIDDPQFTHQDTVWGWDVRCFIVDKLIDRLDEYELSRADRSETSTFSAGHPEDEDEGRVHYFTVTVPQFVERLGYPRICGER